MSNQSQRQPPKMPAGTSSLSDRIAALQRKASDSTPSPSSSSSSSYGPGAGASSMRRTPSASTSPPNAADTSSSSVLSNGSSYSSRSGTPQAVRDRIARFQLSPSSANGEAERPLLPRSSFGFGAPAPNPDNVGGRVLRPYPVGAGGSGNWGEGVLRPQMTGGAWVGTGQSGSSARGSTPGLMPQLTGPTWNRRQASTPESTLAPRQTIGGRDAFADLDANSDGPSSPTESRALGSHGFDVASQAAAMKGLTLQRTGSSTGRYRSVSPLPTLPDVPVKGPERRGSALSGEGIKVGVMNGNGAGEGRKEEKHLPSPPQHNPQASPRIGSSSNAAADTSIEIGVGGASPEEMEKLRLKAQQDEAKEKQGRAGVAEGSDAGEMSSSSIIVSAPDEVGSTSMTSAPVGASATNGPSRAVQQAQPATPQKQPSASAAADISISETSTSSSSSSSLQPHTPVAPLSAANSKGAADMSAAAPPSPTGARNHLPLGPSTVSNVTPRSSAVLLPTSSDSSEEAAVATPAPAPVQSTAPPTSSSTASSALSPSSTSSSRAAGGVVRNKSMQRSRPPPPGQPISLADLDASDDEYEPGWASVISSSRGA
ncbi:hypothetical protein BDZ90DRAFT_234817 [Jaminaea rosea]|uniref:Uncharacterized protein n=1 Tax=Jaminaea rosea TaxID=1569628 RepID=A0A316UMZ4_9BASI|nr:hypothetical protein BDZ90DRAFT_234817 [Jaminaea rosea]PWN24535.1 hypothetical protein BDZ90DRAFT_234817 [Jaminaea rosea]